LTPQQNGQYDRYPGPRSFVDNDVDRHLFFGREREIEHLLHRIRAVRLLVLFGKSGLGKTSLLQAGLYPLLRERGLLPVPVRLNQPDIEPVRTVLDAVWEVCRTHAIECRTGDTEGLWEFFKAADLWRGDVLQTPVLVFDQFEELFTLQPESVRTTVATQLGELSVRGLPTRIRHRVQAGEQMRYTDTPPDVKVILSLREEYVGTLEDLVPNVPAVFEQRFRLAPLGTDDARRAVVEPAALDKPHLFATRPFQYEKPTLDAMMEFLANQQGEVEPFQLQIVCRHAEQQVAARQRQHVGEIQVDEKLLGGRKAMETLLEGFYRNSIRQLSGWSQRSRARTLCEVGLLSPNGHRISIEQGQIYKQYKVMAPTLEKLTQTRLIRKESRPGLEGFYYELSHDSVARAVSRSRRFRVPKRVKVVGLAVFFLLIGVGSWLAQEAYKAEQQRYKAEQLAYLTGLKADEAGRVALQEKQRAEVTASVSQSNVGELVKRGGLLEPEMVKVLKVPTGKFHMGGDSPDAIPSRQVTIKPFAVGRYEVTFEQYDQFALATGRQLPSDSGWGRGRRPVISVSWRDAVDYATWLSQQTGKRYRLPTESEWEYAARNGGKDETWAGTSKKDQLKEYAVYDTKGTEPVGSKQRNGIGLYDMSGNVWEWVEDCWHGNYTGAPTDGSSWLEAGGGNCSQRVLRGGSWLNKPSSLRASHRYWNQADNRYNIIGFRLAQDLP
jgi:formylglycine-generating enzyme required for sulfatase activity